MSAWASKRERLFTLAGPVVEIITLDGDRVRVSARSSAVSASCPCCGRASRRVHSRQLRRLADLPAHGRRVEMMVTARRFRRPRADCARRIYAERLDPGTTAAHGRRTSRLDGVVHPLGVALGGRPAQAIARRLPLPVSDDTLLGTVRRGAPATPSAPRAIGIDDWAWRKGHRHGKLICGLERRKVIDPLPDREPGTVAAWPAARPSVEIIVRDRGGGYGAGAARGRPEAVQVADRRHLFENASAAFLSAVKRAMRDVRRALGRGPVDPAALTAAERLQHEGWRRRADAEAAVIALHEQGVAIKEIVRRTGRSRKRVARRRARRPRRAVPSEGQPHRAPARQAECRVERRPPQRGRPLAPPPPRGPPGEPAGGDGMGDAAAARRRVRCAAPSRPARAGATADAGPRQAHSDRGCRRRNRRTRDPRHRRCVFQLMVGAESRGTWAPVPDDRGHGFQTMPGTVSS